MVDDGGRDVAAVSERTDRRINSVLVVDDASVDAIVLIYLVCVTSYWGWWYTSFMHALCFEFGVSFILIFEMNLNAVLSCFG